MINLFKSFFKLSSVGPSYLTKDYFVKAIIEIVNSSLNKSLFREESNRLITRNNTQIKNYQSRLNEIKLRLNKIKEKKQETNSENLNPQGNPILAEEKTLSDLLEEKEKLLAEEKNLSEKKKEISGINSKIIKGLSYPPSPIKQTDGIQKVIYNLEKIKYTFGCRDSNRDSIRKRLIAIAESVKANNQSATAAQFSEELGKIFENSQERNSGVYRRNAKGLALFIGAVLAYGINIDTLHIIRVLQESPELRAQFDMVAEQVSQESLDVYRSCLEREAGNTNLCQEEFTTLSEVFSRQLDGAASTLDFGRLFGRPDPALTLNEPSDEIQTLLVAIESTTIDLEIGLDNSTPEEPSATAKFDIRLGSPIIVNEDSGVLQISGTQDLMKDSNTAGLFRLSSSDPVTLFSNTQASDALNSAMVDFSVNIMDLSDNQPSGTATFTIDLELSNTTDLDSNFLRFTGEVELTTDDENSAPDENKYTLSNSSNRVSLERISDGQEVKTSSNYWPNKFLGWSISAVAISMGAPFWFDLLGRFMNVRSAGKAILPETSESKKEQPEKKK